MLNLVRVRSFDVASFVAFGAADMGIFGRDVTAEFSYEQLYIPLDLNIGGCRLVVAEPSSPKAEYAPEKLSHIRVTTKYPNMTRQHFLSKGVQVECIKLHGSVELAPILGLSRHIVDLVSTGRTLKANNLIEVEKITDITSCLIVNRTAMKTCAPEMQCYIERMEKALHA
jgi:ATP phosphoribosyltransferase